MTQRTTTQRTVTRSALGALLIGAITATTTVLATPSVATAGAADIPALNQQQVAAAKAKKNNRNNSNRGAKKNNRNNSNRGAKKNNRSNNNRGAKKNNRNNNNRNNGANRNNNRNNRNATSGQTRTLPTPRFMNNPDGVNTHYQAMGRDHADYGKNYSNNSYGYNKNRGHNNRKNNRRHNNRHDYDRHDGHGHNYKKKVVKKKTVNKYYGYGGHGHHSHYGHGYYRPRVGFSVHIGSGVYAGYSSHYDHYDYGYHDPYYDNPPHQDTYCRTTTYTRYGRHGTTTVRRTTCTTDAYGGYTRSPVRVNNTYIYGNTDYDNYRDYQNGTYSNSTYSRSGSTVGTYSNNSASTRDYTEVTPSPPTPQTPAPQPAMERVGMVGPWGDLVNSKASEAQDIFDQIASDYPEDGLPQLGFAIASAQRGQYKSAAAAVERALEIDPASVDRMPDSVALRSEISRLAEELRRTTDSELDRGSYWVTVAAFDYMGGDPYRAKASLSQATQNGADFGVVRGLEGRIER